MRQSLFFNTLQAETRNFIKKETLTQVFYYEFWKNFKDSFFKEADPSPVPQSCPWGSQMTDKRERQRKNL